MSAPGKWVTKPMTEEELYQLRERLEDGDIGGPEKYAVIQRLIESHLLANKQRDRNAQLLLDYQDRMDGVRRLIDLKEQIRKDLDQWNTTR